MLYKTNLGCRIKQILEPKLDQLSIFREIDRSTAAHLNFPFLKLFNCFIDIKNRQSTQLPAIFLNISYFNYLKTINFKQNRVR